MITKDQLRQSREQALRDNRRWKQRIAARDAVASDVWTTNVEEGLDEQKMPLAENVYNEALYDKVVTAAGRQPRVDTSPTRGTRHDRAEKSATKRKHVFMSYAQRSELVSITEMLFMDYFHASASYLIPRCDLWTKDGDPMPLEFRQPYFIRIDPRNVFPLAHDSTGRLTSAIISRHRRFAEIKEDWGRNHPAVTMFQTDLFKGIPAQEQDRRVVEEAWFVDPDQQAVALLDPGMDRWGHLGGMIPMMQMPSAGPAMEWLAQPEKHLLDYCPLSEAKSISHSGEYRGLLESVLPQLQVAQDLMSRYLDNLTSQIYTTTVVSNADIDDFGPGEYVEANDPTQPVAIVHDNPPSQIEVTQPVILAIQNARRLARHPEQRQGDPGGANVTGKGLTELRGAFDADLASAQRAFTRLLSHTLYMTANYDTKWCSPRNGKEKSIDVIEGRAVTQERYNPVSLFKGDFRNKVGYGNTIGLDENAAMLRLSAFKNIVPNVFSDREFAMEANLSEDILQSEREATIERWLAAGEQMIQAQAFQGNPEAWDAWEVLDESLDADQVTRRQAIRTAINSIRNPVPADVPGGGQTSGVDAAVQQARSLASGGIPGNAEGQPAGPDLLNVVPPQIRRTAGELGPGGTAA